MQLHTVQAVGNKKAKRVGRGGKRGTFSGRGTKGQKARAGRRIRPQLRDALMKIPKKRGYRFTAFRVRPHIIQVALIERIFQKGETVSPQTLIEKGVLSKKGTMIPKVKILATGTLTKSVTIEGCELSMSAKEKIEKAGGKLATGRLENKESKI